MPWSVAAAGIGAAGAYMSSKNNRAAAEAGANSQNKLDPRIDNMLFGSDGNQGLLGRYQGYLDQPQSAASQSAYNANSNYLQAYGAKDLQDVRNTATGLMRGNSAPSFSASLAGPASTSLPSYAVGNSVKAPNQNNIDLTGAFNSFINGGNNQALRDSLKYGTDLTNQQFAKNQTDVTNNLMRNVLPSIRSNSVLAGQYGGSRQGVAEGNALSDYTNQLTSANTQLGLANSANTTGQLANDYEQGQNRGLAAAQGLSQLQYTTALQNAATANQAEFMNVNNLYDAHKTNAGFQQQTNLANQGALQQTNLANQNAGLTTNGQNNSAALGGAGLLGGLTAQATGAVNAGDNYGINRAQQVNGLLAPYMSANSSSTSTQPMYQNTAGSVLGGALLGGQLGSMFGGSSYSGTRNQDNYGVNTGSGLGSYLNMFNNNSPSITY